MTVSDILLQIDDKGSTDVTASDKSMEPITDSKNIPGEVEALDTAALNHSIGWGNNTTLGGVFLDKPKAENIHVHDNVLGTPAVDLMAKEVLGEVMANPNEVASHIASDAALVTADTKRDEHVPGSEVAEENAICSNLKQEILKHLNSPNTHMGRSAVKSKQTGSSYKSLTTDTAHDSSTTSTVNMLTSTKTLKIKQGKIDTRRRKFKMAANQIAAYTPDNIYNHSSSTYYPLFLVLI